MDGFERCFKCRQEGTGDVFNVHQRPPRRPIRLQPDLALSERYPVRLFTTISARSRGEEPYAVALRK